ncbi:uncharacterized protein [Eucyclogobius newberryi]|uniref:uncharacterized protein n=1 Tax=Eucyclogobius newberryi TaxID=166745 RepID=UPI003B5A2C05
MTLLEEIRAMSREAARQMEKEDIRTDHDIRSLTHNDLQDLLPGPSNIRLRKNIYEAIHKKRPIHAVLNELKSFIPDDLFRDATSSNGALQDYLQVLKAIKSEVSHVQEFLDAHIELLEKFSQRDDAHAEKNQALVPFVNHSATASSNATDGHPMEQNLHPQQTQASPVTHHFGFAHTTQPIMQSTPMSTIKAATMPFPCLLDTVTYKVIVSGNTLNRHKDVLAQLKSNGPDCLHLQEAQRDEDSQVTIVFCPVVSRVGTDVETALRCITDDKPVILVTMHHNHTAFAAPFVRHDLCYNVVLKVDVFFHDTVPGILKLPQNNEAISKIQTKLRSFAVKSNAFRKNSYVSGK